MILNAAAVVRARHMPSDADAQTLQSHQDTTMPCYYLASEAVSRGPTRTDADRAAHRSRSQFEPGFAVESMTCLELPAVKWYGCTS